jgi:hypothetical protein
VKAIQDGIVAKTPHGEIVIVIQLHSGEAYWVDKNGDTGITWWGDMKAVWQEESYVADLWARILKQKADTTDDSAG